MAVGNVDAHVTAPAAQAIEPGQMLAVMGTSTCHVMNGDVLAEVPGMCGVVDGGITPGCWGYEAGQSGVGDIFAWWVRTGVPAATRRRPPSAAESVHELLTELAADQQVGEHGLVALDWRAATVGAGRPRAVRASIVGLTLATRPEDVYRALLEATAFGTRTIIEAFEPAGVPVDEFVVAGGLTKNAFLMQIYADVTGRPLSRDRLRAGPGAGLGHPRRRGGRRLPRRPRPRRRRWAGSTRDVYVPDEGAADAYDALYAEYRRCTTTSGARTTATTCCTGCAGSGTR